MKVKILKKHKFIFKFISILGVVTISLIGLYSILNAQPQSIDDVLSNYRKLEGKYEVASGLVDSEVIAVSSVHHKRKVSLSNKIGYNLLIDYKIKNLADSNLNLKIVTFAYTETDLSKIGYRKYVPYPNWRKVDVDKKEKRVIQFKSCPNFEKKEVFEFVNSNKLLGFSNFYRADVNKKTRRNTQQYLHPASIDYFQYINENINNIVSDAILVYSINNNSKLKSDAIALNKASHSVLYNRDVAFISCELFSTHTEKYKLFNHFGIIIYDLENESIIYRQIFKIGNK